MIEVASMLASKPSTNTTIRPSRWRCCVTLIATCCVILILQIEVFGQASLGSPEHYLLHYTKGIAAYDQKDYEKAKDEFQLALNAKNGDSKASYYLARAHIRLKHYSDAENILVTLLARDPTFTPAYLDLGVTQYNLGKYKLALDQFHTALVADIENPLPYFYQGLTLNQLGRFEEAPPHFARAWLLDPALKTSATFHSGVAYRRLNLRDEATEAFETVIAADPTSDMAQSARDFLESAKKPAVTEGKPRSWNISLLVSPQYDDNVILQAPGGQLPEGISRQDDYKTTLYGRGEVTFKETETLAIGSSYSFYQSFHTTLDEFDVQGHSPALFTSYKAGSIYARLQYQFDHYSVGREAYMHGHSLNPVVMFTESSNLSTQIQYRFQVKNFNDDMVSFANNSDRDGTNHLTGFTQFFLFSNRRGNLRAGYLFDADDAQNPTWDYQGHRFSLGISSPPLLTMRLDAAFDYYLQDYSHPNDFSPTLAERRDDIINATVTLTRPLNKSLSIGLQYLYNRNKSNVALFDFTRSVVALMGSARF